MDLLFIAMSSLVFGVNLSLNYLREIVLRIIASSNENKLGAFIMLVMDLVC